MSSLPSLRSLAAGLFLAGALALPTDADAAIKVEGKPKVTFFATGSPGFLSIEGVTNALSAADDGTRLTFTVPMSTVSTGIAVRDAHMNDNYVEVAKFPNATLTFAKADVKWPATLGEVAEGTVKATFNAHGVDQPADVTYTLSKTKTGWKVKAKFAFDVAAHGVAIPSYVGVTVDPKMRAEVTADLIDAP